MKRIFVTVPSGHEVGLTSVTLGLVKALLDQKYKVGFLKPISQNYGNDNAPDNTTYLLRRYQNLNTPEPIPLSQAEHLLSIGQEQVLMEQVIDLFEMISKDCDMVVVEGMVPSSNLFYVKHLNGLLVRALDAEVILVSSPNGKSPKDLAEAVEIEAREYRDRVSGSLAGVIVNKIGRKHENTDRVRAVLKHTRVRNYGKTNDDAVNEDVIKSYASPLMELNLNVIGAIPWQQEMVAPRVRDLSNAIEAYAIRRGDWGNRRVSSVAFCTMSLVKSVYYFQDGALIVTTGDRSDIIIAAAMAAVNGVELAGVLICGRYEPDPNILIMCDHAFAGGLPLLSINEDSYQTAIILSQLTLEIPLDDQEKAEKVMGSVSPWISHEWMQSLLLHQREHRISPPEFRNQLIKTSKKSLKKIILPEGEEPRTIQAAVSCFERGIAIPVLLGAKEKILKTAKDLKLKFPVEIQIINPLKVASKYVAPLVELRKHKGVDEAQAKKLLSDPVVLGTMMLQMNEVDGLVAGAIHTSRDVLLPAMQLIKTAPGARLVSSIFFMCLPDQVLVYGDCAINQDPTAEQLAEIAIQSADSASFFRIPPRVAMISYSTGSSGEGSDVDKVRQATALVREMRPDILIDGPLQYDAALIESVAKHKAPDSKVAGRATVLIFPDLNTGNTTYKAVQRSANLVSIGPMLQGLAKPVNDLSRGAKVDDIIYTIALTAIQAGHAQNQAATVVPEEAELAEKAFVKQKKRLPTKDLKDVVELQVMAVEIKDASQSAPKVKKN
jgi:phosphate acetyltransferase